MAEDLFAWYQKKIGTYDKQKWETTLEEKILYGLTHIQLKNTTPNTDFIDLDLVRGKISEISKMIAVLSEMKSSPISKIKPKDGFPTIFKLATIRCLFLPLYAKWWKQQTSYSIFVVIICLYISILINIIVYSFYFSNNENNTEFMEIAIPCFMMWMLSLTHSQIAATNPSPEQNANLPKPTLRRKLSFVRKFSMRMWKTAVDHHEDKSRLNPKFETESRISTEFESDDDQTEQTVKKKTTRKRSHDYRIPTINITTIDSYESDDEYEEHYPPASSDCSYTSDVDDADYVSTDQVDDVESNDASPALKVSCMIWKENEIKKAELSMLDISSAIVGKVESTTQSMDYFYVGLVISTLMGLLPGIFRICKFTLETNSFADGQYSVFELYYEIVQKLPNSLAALLEAAFGDSPWERLILFTSCLQRWILSSLFFFLLSVAENIFKQRFLYAKLFSHLTSFRRAQQSDLPHFRLNKVRNIKTWLSVRSYLKQRGPQRSVDVIVSTAFVTTLLLLSFLCVEFLKETGALNSQYHIETFIWCLGLGVLLLRFMTLGNKINKKYRNLSVLITEQINLHLQIEQKPHKKDELTLANNVLKLAIDLIKELQSPYKISGLCANSILYNTTKLIILSALSGVLSELLGFKLKLHKIKIK